MSGEKSMMCIGGEEFGGEVVCTVIGTFTLTLNIVSKCIFTFKISFQIL